MLSSSWTKLEIKKAKIYWKILAFGIFTPRGPPVPLKGKSDRTILRVKRSLAGCSKTRSVETSKILRSSISSMLGFKFQRRENWLGQRIHLWKRIQLTAEIQKDPQINLRRQLRHHKVWRASNLESSLSGIETKLLNKKWKPQMKQSRKTSTRLSCERPQYTLKKIA